jgi:hypothetical protein
MSGRKIIVSAMMAAWIAVLLGCGDSSQSHSAAHDAGVDDRADAPPAVECDPRFDQLCPRGQTCCFTGIPPGVCTDVAACESPFKVGCIEKPDCNGGVCCLTISLPSADGGSPFGFSFACAASCADNQFQLCLSAGECAAGDVCTGGARGVVLPLPVCVPGDGGASGATQGDGGGDGASDGAP